MNILHTILLSVVKEASLQYPSVKAHWLEAIMFSNTVNTSVIFGHFVNGGICLTAANTFQESWHEYTMSTLTPTVIISFMITVL